MPPKKVASKKSTTIGAAIDNSNNITVTSATTSATVTSASTAPATAILSPVEPSTAEPEVENYDPGEVFDLKPPEEDTRQCHFGHAEGNVHSAASWVSSLNQTAIDRLQQDLPEAEHPDSDGDDDDSASVPVLDGSVAALLRQRKLQQLEANKDTVVASSDIRRYLFRLPWIPEGMDTTNITMDQILELRGAFYEKNMQATLAGTPVAPSPSQSFERTSSFPVPHYIVNYIKTLNRQFNPAEVREDMPGFADAAADLEAYPASDIHIIPYGQSAWPKSWGGQPDACLWLSGQQMLISLMLFMSEMEPVSYIRHDGSKSRAEDKVEKPRHDVAITTLTARQKLYHARYRCSAADKPNSLILNEGVYPVKRHRDSVRRMCGSSIYARKLQGLRGIYVTIHHEHCHALDIKEAAQLSSLNEAMQEWLDKRVSNGAGYNAISQQLLHCKEGLSFGNGVCVPYRLLPKVKHRARNMYRKHHYEAIQLHKNDYLSVVQYVEFLKAQDALLYFHEPLVPGDQGYTKDKHGVFAIGLMDETQSRIAQHKHTHQLFCDSSYSISGYYGVQLFTMHVMTLHGRGAPISQLITNSGSAEVLKVWLEAIKKKCNGGLAVDIIMADCDLAQLNAITSVFPNARYLFCTWHIKRAMSKGIMNYAKVEQRTLARLLCDQLVNAATVDEFQLIMQQLKSGQFGSRFALYIATWEKHAARIALFGRSDLNQLIIRSTNMLCESYHCHLKEQDLDGKLGLRIDVVLHAVVTITNARYRSAFEAIELGIAQPDSLLRVERETLAAARAYNHSFIKPAGESNLIFHVKPLKSTTVEYYIVNLHEWSCTCGRMTTFACVHFVAAHLVATGTAAPIIDQNLEHSILAVDRMPPMPTAPNSEPKPACKPSIYSSMPGMLRYIMENEELLDSTGRDFMQHARVLLDSVHQSINSIKAAQQQQQQQQRQFPPRLDIPPNQKSHTREEMTGSRPMVSFDMRRPNKTAKSDRPKSTAPVPVSEPTTTSTTAVTTSNASVDLTTRATGEAPVAITFTDSKLFTAKDREHMEAAAKEYMLISGQNPTRREEIFNGVMPQINGSNGKPSSDQVKRHIVQRAHALRKQPKSS
ncbi:hypothetical protein GQ42DRAFT_163607 [Ramicandelaber brevisporus]|nr:hypothetical protein GQ42DRAFT_163607 [Ramicandelaber brevisporus]